MLSSACRCTAPFSIGFAASLRLVAPLSRFAADGAPGISVMEAVGLTREMMLGRFMAG